MNMPLLSFARQGQTQLPEDCSKIMTLCLSPSNALFHYSGHRTRYVFDTSTHPLLTYQLEARHQHIIALAKTHFMHRDPENTHSGADSAQFSQELNKQCTGALYPEKAAPLTSSGQERKGRKRVRVMPECFTDSRG